MWSSRSGMTVSSPASRRGLVIQNGPLDSRFGTNPARLSNRDILVGLISDALASFEIDTVIDGLEAVGVPVGPVNTLDRVFGSDQVAARDMQVSVSSAHAASGKIDMIGNPLRFSKTPVSYRRPPPKFGEHTDEVLSELQ